MMGVQKYKKDENVCLGAFVCDMTSGHDDLERAARSNTAVQAHQAACDT